MTLARSIRLSVLAAPVCFALACTVTEDDGDSPTAPSLDASAPPGQDASTGEAGTDLGDCVRYTPAEIAGSRSGAFTSNTDVATIPLPVTDVGGGLLKITVAAQTQATEVSVWLGQGDKKDEARWEASVLDDATGSFYVRLAGGLAYELRAHPTNFRDDRTNAYTVTWTYEPLVDCYEANDTLAAAKRIPVGTPIEAYLHAGIGPDDSRLVGTQAEDWYVFELAESKVTTLRVNVPGDNTAYFSVVDGDGEEIACDDPNFGMGTSSTDTAETMTSCVATLAPGRYWIKGAIANSEYPGTGIGEPVPPSWNRAYTLTVDAQ